MFPSSFADHPGVQQPPAVLSHIPFRAHDAPDSMGNVRPPPLPPSRRDAQLKKKRALTSSPVSSRPCRTPTSKLAPGQPLYATPPSPPPPPSLPNPPRRVRRRPCATGRPRWGALGRRGVLPGEKPDVHFLRRRFCLEIMRTMGRRGRREWRRWCRLGCRLGSSRRVVSRFAFRETG